MADSQNIIEVTGLTKSFTLGSLWGDSSLKGFVVAGVGMVTSRVCKVLGLKVDAKNFRLTPPPGNGGRKILSVLRGMNFTVARGETVALIGRNGSGKSTLLKVLAGVYSPDSGTVQVSGRVSPLIELGAGFHPEFSGRDNILLNAQILGLSRKEVNNRIEEIIDFAELRDFIDYPIRTYSSGMYMRLGFAVAVNVDPDVLLVDEILAVGDARFQAKCHEKLDEFKRRGKTIILVTHSMNVVESWATRAIYLKDGEVSFDGSPGEAVARYLGDVGAGSQSEQDAANLFSGFTLQPVALSSPTMTIDNVMAVPGIACLDARVADEGRELSLAIRVDSQQIAALIRRIVFKILNQDTTIVIGAGICHISENMQAGRFVLTCGSLEILAAGNYRIVIEWREDGHEAHEIMHFNMRVLGLGSPAGFIKLPLSLSSEGEQSRA